MWDRGDILKQIRVDRGWTQEALAARIRIDVDDYRRYEAGEEEPSVDTAIYLCVVLDTTPHELLGWGKETAEQIDEPESYDLTADYAALIAEDEEGFRNALRHLFSE